MTDRHYLAAAVFMFAIFSAVLAAIEFERRELRRDLDRARLELADARRAAQDAKTDRDALARESIDNSKALAAMVDAITKRVLDLAK